MRHLVRFVAVSLAVSFLLSGVANAQWVFLGRKALGKVRQLTGEMKGSQHSGYDAATVLLDAHADKVYSTAVSVLEASKDWRVTRKDDKSSTIEFSDGRLTAGMQISRLEDNLCQILVVSTGTAGKPDATSLVLNGIFRVCKEMGVHCQLADE
jgi:hypothetical protein